MHGLAKLFDRSVHPHYKTNDFTTNCDRLTTLNAATKQTNKQNQQPKKSVTGGCAAIEKGEVFWGDFISSSAVYPLS